MHSKNNFNIGEIVTLRSHPLFDNSYKKIAEFPAHVPPLMIVKDVFFDRSEKKKLYSDELEGAKISDLVKYTCIYFNANKSEFIEKIIYESFLRSYKDLLYYRVKDEKKKEIPEEDQLIPEVLRYEEINEYSFGEVVQFKTKKLEHRKSYNHATPERIPGISYQTPNFIVSGIKKEPQEDLFYHDGLKKRIIPKKSIEVSWFNHFQNKISKKYLPLNSFVKGLEIN